MAAQEASAAEEPSPDVSPDEGIRQERESILQRLRASGRSSEPWTAQATKAISAAAAAIPDVRASTTSCWGTGCFVEARYSTLQSYWGTRSKLIDVLSKEFPDAGGYIGGPASTSNGEVVSIWVVMRPSGASVQHMEGK